MSKEIQVAESEYYKNGMLLFAVTNAANKILWSGIADNWFDGENLEKSIANTYMRRGVRLSPREMEHICIARMNSKGDAVVFQAYYDAVERGLKTTFSLPKVKWTELDARPFQAIKEKVCDYIETIKSITDRMLELESKIDQYKEDRDKISGRMENGMGLETDAEDMAAIQECLAEYCTDHKALSNKLKAMGMFLNPIFVRQ